MPRITCRLFARVIPTSTASPAAHCVSWVAVTCRLFARDIPTSTASPAAPCVSWVAILTHDLAGMQRFVPLTASLRLFAGTENNHVVVSACGR